jgi:C-terminal processing protease CtpA/Prc
LVSDDLHWHDNREPRPANGDELAPGIFYLDLDSLPLATWEAVLPKIQKARGIVLDLRGYVNRASTEVISHLIDHEVQSPLWMTPIVPANRGLQYQPSRWGVRPRAPKLSAKIVVLIAGSTMSAAETILEIIHDNHLAVLVGETSAGTNGDAAYAELPGGFTFRFTSVRTLDDHGWTVQGHGFTPDLVVHPTLEGVRAGRDEILQAGVAVAQRMNAP